NDSEKEIQHINNPVAGPEPIVKKYLTRVKGYTSDANNFYFTDGYAKVEVRVVSDEIIRVRMAPRGEFLQEFSYAVNLSRQKPVQFSLNEDNETFRVETNTVACIIRKDNFLIAFEDLQGKIIHEDIQPMHWEENADFGGYYVY